LCKREARLGLNLQVSDGAALLAFLFAGIIALATSYFYAKLSSRYHSLIVLSGAAMSMVALAILSYRMYRYDPRQLSVFISDACSCPYHRVHV
jgi:ABC-type antimicrobial peptide transport system permease subunit